MLLLQVSAYAIAAYLVEVRELARDLGPLLIFNDRLVHQYVSWMTKHRTASTVNAYLSSLKRGVGQLRSFLEGGVAWGRVADWAASYTRDLYGRFTKVPHSVDAVKQWCLRLKAAAASMHGFCSAARRGGSGARWTST